MGHGAVFNQPAHPDGIGKDHHIGRGTGGNLACHRARTAKRQRNRRAVSCGNLIQRAAQAGGGEDRDRRRLRLCRDRQQSRQNDEQS